MRDQGGFSTRQKWGAAFALFGLGLPLLQWGLEARGVNLSPAQGNLLLVLAALSFLGGLSIIFWSWVARLWPWVWGQIKQRWPFALARTARQLRLRLGEAGQEIQRLSTENEQLEQSNENLKAERKQLSDLLQDTKRENRKLKQQLEVLRAGE